MREIFASTPSTPFVPTTFSPAVQNGFWGGLGIHGYSPMSRLQPYGGIAGNLGKVLGFVFLIDEPITISFVSVSVGTGVAASTADIGLYTYNPLTDATALVASAGGFSTAATAVLRIPLIQGSVTLQPGYYCLGWTQSTAGILVLCLNFNNTIADMFSIMAQTTSGRTLVLGANAPVAGALPASMGVLTGLTNANNQVNPIAGFFTN